MPRSKITSTGAKERRKYEHEKRSAQLSGRNGSHEKGAVMKQRRSSKGARTAGHVTYH
jgi:hypothetical protein